MLKPSLGKKIEFYMWNEHRQKNDIIQGTVIDIRKSKMSLNKRRQNKTERTWYIIQDDHGQKWSITSNQIKCYIEE